MLIDSHCHLNYLDDPDAALARALDAGIEAVVCIGVEQARIREVLALAAASEHVWASVGEHPDNTEGDPRWVEALLEAERVVAVGETGLDYHHVEDAKARAKQRDGFAAHLALAAAHDLPVVVHTRAAERDTRDIIRAHPDANGVLHCFTESWDLAKAALDRGYYVSISGIVTFKNAANVRDVAARIPADRLLIETDAPWLAPVPFRGKPNEPAYVRATAEFLADLRGVPLETLAAQSTANSRRIFNLG